MLERDCSIVFVAADTDACALWRMYMPHIAMPGSSFVRYRQKVDFERMAGHDACVVQRCCTNSHFELIRACKQLGMTVIYDLDDDIFDIPDANPAAPIMGKYRDGFVSCIRMVDICTVSTRVLAKAVKRNVREMQSFVTKKEIPIVVCENRIEERLFADPMSPNEHVTVGWAGSSSHIEDVELITPAVVACGKEFPGVQFEYRGCFIDEKHPVRALKNWRHELWQPVAEYAARMPLWNWSVALAPVTEHEFNASKSAIKMIEAGYCGIPCLASWMEPYADFCRHDPELKWLLCAGASAFTAKLRTLLNEPERRQDLGRRMKLVVNEHYTLRKPHEGWTEVMRLAKAAA